MSSNLISEIERATLFHLSSLEYLDISNNLLNEVNFWGGSFLHLYVAAPPRGRHGSPCCAGVEHALRGTRLTCARACIN